MQRYRLRQSAAGSPGYPCRNGFTLLRTGPLHLPLLPTNSSLKCSYVRLLAHCVGQTKTFTSLISYLPMRTAAAQPIHRLRRLLHPAVLQHSCTPQLLATRFLNTNPRPGVMTPNSYLLSSIFWLLGRDSATLLNNVPKQTTASVDS